MPIFILIISGIIAWILDVLYKTFTATAIEVHFVMMDDTDCCNSNNINQINCKSKYCIAKLMAKIINKIDKAEDSIYIAMYNLTNHQLVNCILNARLRQVSVRLLGDKSMFDGEDNRIINAKLSRAGKF